MSGNGPEAPLRIASRDASFWHNERGLLQAILGNVAYEGVKLKRIFPLSLPNRYIEVSTLDGVTLGIIDDVEELGDEVRSAVEQELQMCYLIPIVTRIQRIQQEAGLWRMNVTTDRGDLVILMRNLHEHIRVINDQRFLVIDIDGRRCEVRQQLLNRKSLAELKKIQ